MPETADFESDVRAYDVLVEVLEVQRRMIETGRELGYMVQRFKSTPADQRPALRHQFDEVTAILAAYTEQIRELVVVYRDGE
jgi:hypothetical protein